MAALSGGNLIHDAGYIESGMCSSLQALVICDELIGKAKHIVKGIEVTGRTLALDVIKAVGPGGNFIAEEHTAANFKDEWWFPTIYNRQRHDNWAADGKPTMGEAALRKLRAIVETHQPMPIEPKVQSRLNDILKNAEG